MFTVSGTAASALAVLPYRAGYHKASSGDCVQRPVHTPALPPGAAAQCTGGGYPLSEDSTDDDTCHGRGGVATILR